MRIPGLPRCLICARTGQRLRKVSGAKVCKLCFPHMERSAKLARAWEGGQLTNPERLARTVVLLLVQLGVVLEIEDEGQRQEAVLGLHEAARLVAWSGRGA